MFNKLWSKLLLNYLKKELRQVADYLHKEKGYPGSVKELQADILEAIMYTAQHGDI